MSAIIANPPQPTPDVEGYRRVFLAGSIDMGEAEDWQAKIVDAVKDFKLIISNPRRKDWDPNWEQSIENRKFKEQVDWELDNLEAADKIVMVLAKGSMSPISLLEFGLFAKRDKLVVYCPNGFWRKGNIDIVCERYGIPQVQEFEELITLIKYS